MPKAKAKLKKPAAKKPIARKSLKKSAPKVYAARKTITKSRLKKVAKPSKLAGNKKMAKTVTKKLIKVSVIRSVNRRQPGSKIKVKKTGFSRPLIKIISLFLLIAINWFGISAIGNTLANFNDTESSQNFFQASNLGFSLSGDDFSPAVTPTQNATSTIDLQNDGLLDFIYGARVANASGTLCSFLELEDSLGNIYRPLIDFSTATTTFSTTSSIIFDARLTSDSKNLQNKTCEFKFVFDGAQLEGAGFSDMEEISRTIVSGEWPSVVINKIYYDVDEEHSGNLEEWKYEWIELYNPLDQPVNLKNWQICDNTNCKTINANVDIPALGYALLSHDASLWQHYWEIPEGVEIINLGNSPSHLTLSNTADMLVLINTDDAVVDQMNWGTPIHSWANYDAYSSGVWEPGVPDASEGHMLARVPSGFDMDLVSDWQDLALPTVVMVYPVGGEVWYVGHTYNIQWTASSTNESLDSDLKIDIYYSRNSGATWGKIATSTENDGSYDWHVPLFIEPGHYYVPSPHARIKVVATGPENFMVQAWASSNDFCPPIDYDVLSPEVQQLVDQLVNDGVIDENEVVRGGVKNEEQITPVIIEPVVDNISTTNEEATTTEEIITTEETIVIEQATTTEEAVVEITDSEEQTAPEETTIITEEQPAIEEQPVVVEEIVSEPAPEPPPASEPEPDLSSGDGGLVINELTD